MLRSMNAIEKAVAACGSQSELARRLGLKPQSVQGWVTNGRIPAERVLEVECASGVSRHDLRPDLYPRDAVA